MPEIHLNNVYTAVGSVGYTHGSTTFPLAAGYGATLVAKLAAEGQPSISGSNPFRVTAFIDYNTYTVFRATSLSGDILTGAYAEGSSTQNYSAGTLVVGSLTSAQIRAIVAGGGGGGGTPTPYAGTVYLKEDYGAVADGTTDNSASFAAALTATIAAGGGDIVFPPGVTLINNQILIGHDSNTPPRQYPIRLRGAGTASTMISPSLYGGSVVDLRYSGSGAKILAVGAGKLEIDHLTLTDLGTSSNPFVEVTNAVLHAHHFAIVGNPSKDATTADQEGILLGGTGASGLTLTADPNAPFQGYGSVIRDSYFDRLKTGVHCQIYSNGSVIDSNTFGLNCGSTVTGAIVVEGASGEVTSGVVITNNLIEAPRYAKPIHLKAYATQCYCAGNTIWDADPLYVIAHIYIEANSSGHVLIPGQTGGGTPFVASADANYGRKNTIIDQKSDNTSGMVVGGIGIGHASTVAAHGQVNIINDQSGHLGIGTASAQGALHVVAPTTLDRGLVVETPASHQVNKFEVRTTGSAAKVFVDATDIIWAEAFIGPAVYYTTGGALAWATYVSGGKLYYYDQTNNRFLIECSPGASAAASTLRVSGNLLVDTSLTVSALGSGMTKLTSGLLGLATAGTDYLTPSGAAALYSPIAGSSSITTVGTLAAGAVPASLVTGTLAAARLPTTGLTISAWASTITTDADASTVTFDLSVTNDHAVTLGGNRTLALANEPAAGKFTVLLTQDATGSRTVTWWGGIRWPGGTTPTLTTTAAKTDVFTFIKTGAGAYLGFTAGLNL